MLCCTGSVAYSYRADAHSRGQHDAPCPYWDQHCLVRQLVQSFSLPANNTQNNSKKWPWLFPFDILLMTFWRSFAKIYEETSTFKRKKNGPPGERQPTSPGSKDATFQVLTSQVDQKSARRGRSWQYLGAHFGASIGISQNRRGEPEYWL